MNVLECINVTVFEQNCALPPRLYRAVRNVPIHAERVVSYSQNSEMSFCQFVIFSEVLDIHFYNAACCVLWIKIFKLRN